jgi:hypothetical protein
MIRQPLRKSGDTFVVTIPEEEIQRYGLKEGQLLGLYLVPLAARLALRQELRDALDRSWEQSAEVYRELAETEDEMRAS